MGQDSSGNRELMKWLSGMALGAVAMYLADPAQGKRRRAIAQDRMRTMTYKTSNILNKTGNVLNSVMHDAGDRFSGLQSQANRIIGQGSKIKPIDDHVLEARVRSKLGRTMMNSHFIDVKADRGYVTLRGSVPQEDKQYVVQLVRTIPGVIDVRDKLSVHDESNSAAPGDDAQPSQESLSGPGIPSSWWLALIGGGIIGYYGLSRRTSSGQLIALAGLGYLARTLGYGDLTQLWSSATGAGAVEVERSVQIKASPETVFDIWTKYENFPHFMSHVIEVRDLGKGRSHWVVRGPANNMLEWDSVLTQSSRPTLLAWRSEPGAQIENSGSVYLEPYNDGTRATVRMTYYPPAGSIGRGIATMLGNNPEQELEDDLMRMKSFIESGVPSRDAVQAASTQGKLLH